MPDSFVTAADIKDVVVNPTDVPSCASVLKTAPAKACVLVGNTSEMIRIPIVNSTSTDSGDSSCAKKASYQYGQLGLIVAMRAGAIAHRPDVIKTACIAGILSIKNPVVKFVTIPRIMFGRILSDVSKAVSP